MMPKVLFKKYPKTKRIYKYLYSNADVQGLVIANPKRIHKSLHVFRHTAKKSVKLLYHNRLLNAVDVTNHAYVIPDLTKKFQKIMNKKVIKVKSEPRFIPSPNTHDLKPLHHYQRVAKQSLSLAHRSSNDLKKMINLDKLHKSQIKQLLKKAHQQHNQIQVNSIKINQIKVTSTTLNKMKKRLLRQRKSNYNRVRRMKYRLHKQIKAQHRSSYRLAKVRKQAKSQDKQINHLNKLIQSQKDTIHMYKTGNVDKFIDIYHPDKYDSSKYGKAPTKPNNNESTKLTLSTAQSNKYFTL